MDEKKWLADQFEANRPHLRAVAYRMLGSVTEAEDAVQEGWLRLNRVGGTGIDNLGGWLPPPWRGCAWTCCARADRDARSRWRPRRR